MAAHRAYQTLDARLRLGQLTVAQVAQITAGVFIALGYGVYLSPFSTGLTVMTAPLVPGLPMALAYGAQYRDFDALDFCRAVLRYSLSARRYLPGPGRVPSAGYLVERPREPGVGSERQAAAPAGRLEELWD
jgi:hypothetical protein